MRDQAVDKTTGGGAGRQPHRQRPARDRTAPRGLPGAQASLGNAGVVQMLRMAGHPWAQERHRHGPGCGHRAPARSGGLGTPAVQRRIGVRGPQSATPQGMSNAGDVKEFLSRNGVTVRAAYAKRYRVSEALAASVHYRLDDTIDEMLRDSDSRVYDDNEGGAKKLAADICDRIGPPTGETAGAPVGQAPLRNPASPFSRRPTAAGSGSTTGAGSGRRGIMDSVAGRAADAMADATPRTTAAEAAMQGATGALTGRLDALSGNVSKWDEIRDGVRWAAYLASEADVEKADGIVQRIAAQSPGEGERLTQNWHEMKRAFGTNAAAKTASSLGVGTMLGRLAGAFIPGGQVVSTAAGMVSLGNNLAELSQQVKRFEQQHPQVVRAVREHQGHSLERLSEQVHEATMDVQMQSMGF
ncbi:hypothetical protein ACFW5W_02100 [Streptomyces sp. NPDC058783]|uniref:hypothetical protein n=1 Tax=unclassified Streptomyces TaxID=2593676 RepID=UPI003663AE08